MINGFALTAFTMSLLLAMDAGAQTTPPPTSMNVEADVSAIAANRYAVLAESNIFLRDLRRPSAPATSRAPASTRPAPSPEQLLVLTGVVFEELEFRAYFENLQTGSVVKAAGGDAVARGRIGEIMLDAIAYASPNGIQWIEIGQDLTGAFRTAPSDGAGAGDDDDDDDSDDSSPTTSAASTNPVSAEDSDASPAGRPMSVEERMRQNRRRELDRD